MRLDTGMALLALLVSPAAQAGSDRLTVLLGTGSYTACDADLSGGAPDEYQGTYPIVGREGRVVGTARVCHVPIPDTGDVYTERLAGVFELGDSTLDLGMACFILAELDGTSGIVIEGYVLGGTGDYAQSSGRVSARGTYSAGELALQFDVRFE